MMTQLRSLLADEVRSASVLDVSQQAVMALRNLGRDDEAREAREVRQRLKALSESNARELVASEARLRRWRFAQQTGK